MGRAVVSAPMALGMGCALILCWSLQAGWGATLGPLFNWLANLGITIPLKGLPDVGIHPFGYLHTIDRNIRAWLTQGIALSERSFVRFLNATVEPFLLMAGVALALGLALFELAQYVRHSLPHTIKAQVAAPTKAAIDKKAREVNAQQQAAIKALGSRVDGFAARLHSIAVPAPHGATWVNEKLDRLLRDRSRTRDRLHKIEKLLAVAGFTGLLVAALGRLRLGWLRCPALLRMGNRFGCGGFSFLEALLAVTFEAIVITDLCLVVNAMTKAARLFAKELEYLSTQISGLIECQEASRPDALSVAWFEPPPLSPYVET